VLLRPLGNVIYFMPPYIVGDAEIERMVTVAREGLDLAVVA
jgi:adenosylmethionine-8-amino-7-oxononanoate aminotransferase